LLGENQFFGHEDYFVGNNKINKVRTIDAQAISSAEIYFMDHKYFMKLRHSELGIFLKKKHKMMIQVRKEQISKQIELEEIWNNQKMREKASF
jgi:CRP-like cAMP-binding protein